MGVRCAGGIPWLLRRLGCIPEPPRGGAGITAQLPPPTHDGPSACRASSTVADDADREELGWQVQFNRHATGSCSRGSSSKDGRESAAAEERQADAATTADTSASGAGSERSNATDGEPSDSSPDFSSSGSTSTSSTKSSRPKAEAEGGQPPGIVEERGWHDERCKTAPEHASCRASGGESRPTIGVHQADGGGERRDSDDGGEPTRAMTEPEPETRAMTEPEPETRAMTEPTRARSESETFGVQEDGGAMRRVKTSELGKSSLWERRISSERNRRVSLSLSSPHLPGPQASTAKLVGSQADVLGAPEHLRCEKIVQSFGDFAKIGAGSSSVVYRAQRLADKRSVVLKAMRRRDPEIAILARREFDLLTDMRHPNIISAVDFMESPSCLAVVLEDFAGRSLRTEVRSHPAGRLDEVTAMCLFAQVAAALVYLHGRGVVHRDLKPDNLLVSPEGLLKVIDFNVACSTSDGALLTPTGTREFLAPEVLNDVPFAPQADVWAAGLCLSFMLHGRISSRHESKASTPVSTAASERRVSTCSVSSMGSVSSLPAPGEAGAAGLAVWWCLQPECASRADAQELLDFASSWLARR